MKITVLPETTIDPISLIGRRAGVCWGANISDEKKNYNRGLECIQNNHGRTLEYPEVHLVIEDCSARVIREYYTHIGGSPTRLQESTRYVDSKNFRYITPPSIAKNTQAEITYNLAMNNIMTALDSLESMGIPREDAAMILPLGMATKIVDKRNLRNLIEMSHNRLCNRAYWEFRLLMKEIFKELSTYSDEWKYIVDNYMKPKCEMLGYCPEKNSCGKMPKEKQ